MKSKIIFACLLIFISITGCTPRLHDAVETNNLPQIKRLLEAGANINEKGYANNKTPLMAAAYQGNLIIVEHLISKGADLNLQVDKISSGNQEHQWGFSGFTALHFASYYGNVEIVRVLADNGANLSIQDHKGFTALHYAAYYGFTEIAKILADHRADLTIKDNNGFTAYDYAGKFYFWEIAKYLEKATPNDSIKLKE